MASGMRSFAQSFAGLLGCLVVTAALPVCAQVTWLGDTSTNFTTGGNWEGGIAPTLSDVAVFGSVFGEYQPATSGVTPVAGLQFLRPEGGWTITAGGRLEVGASGIDDGVNTSGTTTISGTVRLTVNPQTWTVGTGGTLLVTDEISMPITNLRLNVVGGTVATARLNGTGGSGNLLLGGGGTLVVTGSSIVGEFQILEGSTVIMGHGHALGSTSRLYPRNNSTVQASVDLTGTNSIPKALRIEEATFSGSHSIAITGSAYMQSTSVNAILTNDLAAGRTLTLGDVLGNAQSTLQTRTITFQGAGDTIVTGSMTNGVASGGMNYTKAGSGRLTLQGEGTFSGTMRLTEGTLRVEHAAALGLTSAPLVVSGGTLDLGGLGITKSGAVTLTGGVISSGTLTNDTLAFDVRSGTVSADLAGSVGLTKTTNGLLVLSGSNSYAGVTTVSGTGGTLQIAARQALYGGGTASWTAANVVVNGTNTLAVNVGGSGEFSSGDVTTLLTNLGGLGGAVDNNGLRARSRIGFDTTNAAGGTFTIADDLADSTGTGGGAIGLTKLGSGRLVLAGINTASGTTTALAGILQYSSPEALYNSGTANWVQTRINVRNGGTLALSVGGSGEFGTADVTNLLAGLESSTSAVTGMNAGSAFGFDTTNAAGGSFTIAGVLADSTGVSGGARGVTKLGTNTLVLSGSNTFSGPLTVAAGTLSVAAVNDAGMAGPLGSSAAAVILGSPDAAGTLAYTGATVATTKPFTAATGGTAAFSIAEAGTTLTLAGLIGGDGDKSFGGAGSYVIAGGLSGTGSVFKTGGGAFTLTQAGHAGGYDIQAGRLNLNAAQAIGNAVALTLGGGLELDNASDAAVTINNGQVAISLGSSLDFIGTQDLNMGVGTVTLGSSSDIAVRAGTLTFGGNMVDGGSGFGITKTGTGRLVLTGLAAGAFSGNSVLDAGELFLSGTSTLGGGSGATITVNPGATLRIGATASTGGVMVVNVGGSVVPETLQNSGQTFGANQALSSADALFNGAQTIDAGVIVSASEDWLGSIPAAPTAGRIVMENGATLRSTQAISINANKGIEIAGAAATFDAATGSIFINSAVTGTGALIKTGTGGFRILNQSNSYAGGTEIRQGTFGIYGDGSLGQAGTRVLLDGATLNSGQGTAGQTVTIDSTRSLVLGNGKTSNLDATNGSTLAYAGVLTEESAEGAAASLRFGTAGSRAGTVLLGGANTYRGDTIVNSGTLKLGSGGSFTASPRIIVGDSSSIGAVLDLSAKSTFSIDATQTLMGKGTVRLGTDTALTVNGLLSPGNSPGLLTYDGGGTVTLSGTTLIEIWGTSRGTNPGYDAIDVLGGTELVLGGVLQFDFDQLFAEGTSFSVFTADGSSNVTGTFTSIVMVGTSYTDMEFTNNAGVWTTNRGVDGQQMTFSSTTGTLIIVPEPGAYALAGIGLAMAVWCRARRRCHDSAIG